MGGRSSSFGRKSGGGSSNYNIDDLNSSAKTRQSKDLDYFVNHMSGESPLIVSEGNKSQGIKPLFMKRNNDNSMWWSTGQKNSNGKIDFTARMPITRKEQGIELHQHVTQRAQLTQSQFDGLLKQYNLDLNHAQKFKWRHEKWY